MLCRMALIACADNEGKDQPAHAQADLCHRCPLSESLDTEEYINEHRNTWSVWFHTSLPTFNIMSLFLWYDTYIELEPVKMYVSEDKNIVEVFSTLHIRRSLFAIWECTFNP